jgi:hypothetical protein
MPKSLPKTKPPPLATRVPSGEKATALTASGWPWTCHRSAPLEASHAQLRQGGGAEVLQALGGRLAGGEVAAAELFDQLGDLVRRRRIVSRHQHHPRQDDSEPQAEITHLEPP